LAAGEGGHALECRVPAQPHAAQVRADLEWFRLWESLLEGLEGSEAQVELVDVVLREATHPTQSVTLNGTQ
jgi:hypothetical protein